MRRQNTTKNQLSSVMSPSGNSLLDKTCSLIKNCPEYLEVVSVARKTDARHWGDLFSAAGRSTEYVHILSADFFSLLNILIIPYFDYFMCKTLSFSAI